RLEPPLPAEAVDSLLKSLDDPEKTWTPDVWSRINGWTDEMNEAHITAIWALGASGDAAGASKLQPRYRSPDPGICQMGGYALGALPGDQQLVTLRTALGDAAPDVRWNAAVALARHGNHDGVSIVAQMLDRAYVEQTVKRDVRQDEDRDPIGEVIVSGLRAAASLKDASLQPSVERLSQSDRSMRVRQAALEAMRMMRGEG